MKKLYKNWFIHNVVGHPLMGILQAIGLNNLGTKIHDVTIPGENDESE